MADESKKYITKDYLEFNLVTSDTTMRILSAETKTYYVFTSTSPGQISVTAPPPSSLTEGYFNMFYVDMNNVTGMGFNGNGYPVEVESTSWNAGYHTILKFLFNSEKWICSRIFSKKN